MTETFQKRSHFDCSADELFQWHERPGAFQRLNPPFEPVTVRSAVGGIRDGAKVELAVPLGPGPLKHLTLPWRLEHRDYIEGRQFRDVQVSGPFRSWRHTHAISPDPAGSGAILDDTIEYELPLGVLGRLGGGWLVRRKLTNLFAYRHTVTRNDLTLFKTHPTPRPMRVLISGASGLVGSELAGLLSVGGHTVVRLVRRPARDSSEISWDPARQTIDAAKLSGFDAVVNLAGENIAAKRWSESRKAALRSSRIDTTRFLVEALGKTSAPPNTFISASAIGIYGSRGADVLDDKAIPGGGFLADLTKEWEESARSAETHGMRAVLLRFGIILSARGGALQKMLPPFLAGLGGPLGSGEQYMSWIALDDVVGAIYTALVNSEARGALNVVSPNPVTNAGFTAALARVVRRPAIVPVPAAALTTIFGDLAREALLSSARVTPTRLQSLGYTFFFPELEGALRHLLGRPERTSHPEPVR